MQLIGPLMLAFMLAVCVFVPTFIIALAMLHSARRSLALAAVFTLGAGVGYFAALLLARWLHLREDFTLVVVISGGALAGALLAVYGLAKLTGSQPWRRS